MGIVEELFYILSVRVFANQFNESATCRARCCTCIGKSGVCLFGVAEGSAQGLRGIRKECLEVPSEKLP